MATRLAIHKCIACRRVAMSSLGWMISHTQDMATRRRLLLVENRSARGHGTRQKAPSSAIGLNDQRLKRLHSHGAISIAHEVDVADRQLGPVTQIDGLAMIFVFSQNNVGVVGPWIIKHVARSFL